MMLNYLVVDNLSTTIPGQIRDKKVIFNKFSDLYVVENQVVFLREIGLIKSPIHYQTDGCTQVQPFFLFRISVPSPAVLTPVAFSSDLFPSARRFYSLLKKACW